MKIPLLPNEVEKRSGTMVTTQTNNHIKALKRGNSILVSEKYGL